MPNEERKTKLEWNKQQKRVIYYDGGDMLVSASAGSGKTTVMLERVLRLIGKGGSVDRMLISTFTVSAADDMRNKLAVKLREKYAETGDERYLRELDKLPSADICTLDKWCQKTVRRYFYVSGDDPAFDVTDPAESKLMAKESVAEAFEEEDGKQDADYVELCACFVKDRKDDGLRGIVTAMLDFASSRADDRKWLASAADAYDTDEARAVIERCGEELNMAAFSAITAFETAAFDLGFGKEAAKHLSEMHNLLDGGNVQKWSPLSGALGKDALCSELCKAARDKVKAAAAFTAKRTSARNGEARRAVKKLSAIALRALDIFESKKYERGKLDFNDVQRRVLRILSSSEGDKIRDSLDYIFIDESQDINSLQESIISMLGKGNLFFVGDVKQSIYAFRNSEPKAFLRKKEQLSVSDGTVELNLNYRSSAGILDFCNLVFSRAMTERFGGIDYENEGKFVVPARGRDDSVEIFTFDDSGKKEASEKPDFSEVYSVRDARRSKTTGDSAEADAVVRRIVSLVHDEGYDYDDIAVIYRSYSPAVGGIVAGLRECGVPVASAGGIDLTEGKVNRLLLSMLRLADNFYDDVALVSVMLSPIGGFCEDELAAIRAASPEAEHFYECVTAYAETDGGDKARRLLDICGRYARLSRVIGVGELAGMITSENKLFSSALALQSGAACADSLGRLLKKAGDFVGSLSDFLEQIAEYPPDRDKIMPPGSVRVMTVHASKGLEFPVVVLCALGKKYNMQAGVSGALFDDELGVGLESRNSVTGERHDSEPLIAIKLKKEKANKEEEMRILYVALTRAKRKLIIPLPASVTEDDKIDEPAEAKSFASLLAPAARIYGINPAPSAETGEFTGRRAASVDAGMLGRLKREIFSGADERPSDIKKTVTGLIAETYVSEDAALGVKTLTGAEYDGERAGEAMRRGTAYHAALERADFSLTAEEQAARLASEVPDFGLIDIKKLSAAISAMRGLTAGAASYREQPFVLETDAELLGEPAGLIVQGVIDLMVIRGGECEIVDYKTGGINAARREKYIRQLGIYSMAAEKLLGVKVTRARAYLIDEERFMD